jgi:O-antigen/teichoic acid export membrane protein
MGIVRKQSIISSLITYAGFVIGAINVLWLFPHFVGNSGLGLTRVLLDVSLFFSTACTLGSVPIAFKFFPFYQSYLPPEKNDLHLITFSLCFLGCLLFIIIMPHLKPWIIRKFGEHSPLFVDYFDLIYPFTIIIAFFNLLEAYAWSLKKTVLSNAMKELVFRVLTSLFIIAFALRWISFSRFINLYSYVYLLPALILVMVLGRSGKIRLNFSISSVTRRLKGKIITFGSFIFLGSLLNIISRTNDTIIIASKAKGGLVDAAVFSIATYLITIMEVPQRSLVSITTPFIAEAWHKRDVKKIDEIYKKTALNLLIVGLAIFGLVLLNIDDAVKFLGPAYEPIKVIVLYMGIAKMIDLGTGMNSQILFLSKFWKIDFFTQILLVVVSIPLNYWLTSSYGVIGPAFGNLIALTTYNSVRFIFLWKFFKLQPFTAHNLKAVLLALACFALVYLIPDTGHIYLNVFIRSAVFLLLYGFAILKFKASDDITGLVETAKAKFRW